MILTLNAIRDADERRRFDEVVLPRLRPLSSEDFEVRHLLTDSLPETSAGLSRLLISGSELSASQGSPWDDATLHLICAFVAAGKPVFGICWGHQMIARALAGDDICRRAAVPEFGWKRLIAVVEDPLFAGLEDRADIVTMHSHYDEVRDLGGDFTILASTDDCRIQAFRYRDLPVWGVQFHPELGFEEGRRMLRRNLESESRAKELAGADLPGEDAGGREQAEANLGMLASFLTARPAEVAA